MTQLNQIVEANKELGSKNQELSEAKTMYQRLIDRARKDIQQMFNLIEDNDLHGAATIAKKYIVS
jgi:HPt (histidine-containing phosphotransfer) domain-containing protein